MRRCGDENGEVAHCKIDALALCAQKVPYRCSPLLLLRQCDEYTENAVLLIFRALACPQEALAELLLSGLLGMPSVLQAASHAKGAGALEEAS